MIDLHCHLVPGVDDGPDTLEQSLAMCRLAVADGITHAVVTPHMHPGRWQNNRHTIRKATQELQSALQSRSIPLRLGFAAEVRLSDEVMQQVSDDEIPFYGEVEGYRIMLLEFPHGHIVPGSDRLVNWLLQRNIRPLIAHPERNRQVMKDPALLQPFLEAGCWLQITAGAITGGFGDRARAIAGRLLEEDKVRVVASDAHNAKIRPPSLKQAWRHISSRYGESRAVSLMCAAPAAIASTQFDA